MDDIGIFRLYSSHNSVSSSSRLKAPFVTLPYKEVVLASKLFIDNLDLTTNWCMTTPLNMSRQVLSLHQITVTPSLDTAADTGGTVASNEYSRPRGTVAVEEKQGKWRIRLPRSKDLARLLYAFLH